MKKILAQFVILGAVLCFTSAVQAQLFDVTQPGDPITAVDTDDPLGLGTWPAGEAPVNAINNVTQKYLNFGVGTAPNQEQNTGFIVTPAFQASSGGTIVTGIRLYTANDAVDRDPASYMLAGAASAAGPWTTISSGPLALPAGRNAGGTTAINPAVHFNQQVTFANTTPYLSYRLLFPTVKADTNSMQIAEVELLSAVPEPSTIALAGMGLIGLIVAVRRRRK